jgi:hypothetical protein
MGYKACYPKYIRPILVFFSQKSWCAIINIFFNPQLILTQIPILEVKAIYDNVMPIY